jgi:RNA polymerase sigma factor (TIGR02999 family)
LREAETLRFEESLTPYAWRNPIPVGLEIVLDFAGEEVAVSQITSLLDQWSQGRRGALDELMPLVYSELKRIAAAYLEEERPSATLQVTALVHEAYLRLVRYHHPKFENGKHFYVVAAQSMRRILVDHARRRKAAKRDATLPPDSGIAVQPDVDVLGLDIALNHLAASDPAKARVVELRYFAGLSVEEVAEITGASPATVKRQWAVAKTWLFRELRGE